MKPINYLQVIKTTDAELKGFFNLSDEVKRKILPLFELTRSRTTKIVPEGSIYRRLENIREAVGDNEFVLDLTSHEDLMNYEIEELLDDENGFSAWTSFIDSLNLKQVIPAIHVYQDGDPDDIVEQVRVLSSSNEKVAFRVGSDDTELEFYLRHIKRGLASDSQLLLVFDAGFITEWDYQKKKNELDQKIKFARRYIPDADVTICGSSFPKSVKDSSSGKDDYGKLPIWEWVIFCELKGDYPNIIYGDYASVHPVRYQTGGGGWVPRIDYPLDEYIIYYRYRRDDGSYPRCAEELVDDVDFDDLSCWGTEQIHSALSGEPNGKSPSFWIAVRLNIHITRKATFLC
ncbi:beta family protein [Marinobacter adhaerens]|uniref:beta family protein n=1 Tax=Marinobacter adhaerens TaxID=1033846 RepID=UPI001C582642|nr:beta family protein [Marinobacter adhaerens]MBW3225446.1 beta family protein [Marinobacter adhaerens]